ncbi:ABC transporter ATP-binding protein [Marininema mesophilum]|uniref:ABC transporter ATP-binding protein n=1 Tax=Marininema mesophilum TaxID=1048340 RepID=UPI000B857A40|nr:ABC transporter transmembrane domain-containing protein [Marininema mesophilum]
MSVFKDLWWYFKLEKSNYLMGIAMFVAICLLQAIPPYGVRMVLDTIAKNTITTKDLTYWSLIILASGLLTYGLGFYRRVKLFASANRLSKLLRNRLYDHFTKMSPQFFHKYRTGDLMARSTNDVQAVSLTAGEGVLTLADSIIQGGLVILIMAFFIDWKLTAVSLLPMPVLALLTTKYGRLLHRRFHDAQKAFSSMNDRVQENISGIRVVKSFGKEEAEKKQFEQIVENVVHKNIAVARINALFDPTMMFIVMSSFFLAVAFGSTEVLHGSLSIGELTQFILYLGLLIWPMLAFGWLFNIVERGRVSYHRIENLLQTEPPIREKPDALITVPSGAIHFHIPTFHYPDIESAALKEIDIHVEKGETLGIVGKIGSGKTTLLRLLLREFESKQVNISIGGVPIRDFKLFALREAISYVSQDPILFSATIAENMALGKPEATQDEIESAAKVACIHEDILNFKDGYNTTIGEQGVTLSGGQRQRLSIARALLQDSEILILDDSLSAVDTRTEHAILQSLRENRKNKTTLISAHRLSSVEKAHQIIVLEEGKVKASGTHHELIQQNEWYKQMVDRQQLESLILEGGGMSI